MQIFETVACNLCKSKDYIKMYKSNQYSNSKLGTIEISIVMCNKCNFIFQNPQLTTSALNEHYKNNSSGQVYSLQGPSTRTTKLLRERTKFIKDSLKNINISSICDVGGGKGLLLDNLKINQNIKKFLIEPSNAILECTNPNIIKIKKFVEDIDDNNEKFDFLMCISSLEHFKNPLYILKIFNNLLNENGVLLIEVPNSLKPYKTTAEFFSYEHLNHFTIETILKFLHSAGFYPTKIEESKIAPNIRISANKKDHYINKQKTFSCFDIYKNMKLSLKEKLNSKIVNLIDTNNINNLAIYGAGDHTKFVIESFNLLEYITVFIDSDPKKWGLLYYNKLIIAPNELSSHNIKNILISSYDYEKEIFASLSKIVDKNINIVRLYNT